MTGTLDASPTVTAAEVIERAREARLVEQRAAFRQLELALQWAHLHPCPADEWPAHWGEVDLHGETIVPLAGEGAPLVAEFAPADLGAALGIGLQAARQLVADALELAHRLPRLWDLVQDGRVPAWRARRVAGLTRDLSVEAVAFADRLISATPDRVGQVHAERLVQEARLYFDPDRAVADEGEALAKRGVWLRHGVAPATTEVWMTLDTPDAEQFDATVGRIAHDLRELGDADPLDVRRARAVGVLADPQYALELMSGRDGAAPTPGTGGVANLYLHLTPADLARDLDGDVGAVSIEKLGAATTRLLAGWLARCTGHGSGTGGRVLVRPVLDLASQASVDRHDPPQAMREAAVLRDAHCVFPGCARDSRSCDLDHITEYVQLDDGGPPGQTTLANLGPLCRTHHRVKTHSAWTYRRTDRGHYEWVAPTGHRYDVEPSPRHRSCHHPLPPLPRGTAEESARHRRRA